LAEELLNMNGVVYGVAMSDDCKSAHFLRVTNIEQLGKLRGSKYFQAHMGDTFKLIKEDLEKQLPVLFSGTGCQILGLKSYLGKDYSNLYCVDIICHGTPSPALWKKYVEYREEEWKARMVQVDFRSKAVSWENYGIETVNDKMENLYSSKESDPFMLMFLRNFCLRPSCHNCMEKKDKKSDITLGDFWGINASLPEMNDDKGTSLVLLRTEKGRVLFNKIQVNKKTADYSIAIKYNTAENHSVPMPLERPSFFRDMSAMSFKKLSRRYGFKRDNTIACKIRTKGLKLWCLMRNKCANIR